MYFNAPELLLGKPYDAKVIFYLFKKNNVYKQLFSTIINIIIIIIQG